MTKWAFFVCLLLIQFLSFSQSVVSVRNLLLQNKLLEAKTEVDNLLSIPDSSTNANAWYFKGFIYNIISKDSSIQIPLTNAKAVAFNAFIKCLQFAPKHKWLEKDHYTPLFDIYVSFFESGKNDLKVNKYETAIDHFLNAEKVKNYLYNHQISYKDFKFPILDTQLIFNIAFCAEKLNKEKEMIYYSMKLADAQLKEAIYIPLYHKLVDYYIKIYDEIGFRKYLSIGRKLFPYDQYWLQAEIDMTKAGKLSDALVKDYLAKQKNTPNDFNLSFQFASDLINILYNPENKIKKFSEWFPLLEQNIEKCLALQTNGLKAELLASTFHFKEATRENVEDSASHKKNHYVKSLQYAEIVYNDFAKKNQFNRYELDTYKLISKRIIDIYQYLQNDEKLKFYQEKNFLIENTLPVYTPIKQKD